MEKSLQIPDCLKKLMAQKRLSVLSEVSLKKLTTFKIGGNADAVWYPTDREALVIAARNLEDFFVLGNGSNILASDAGYRGNIISTVKMTSVTAEGELLTADAGCPLTALAQKAASLSLTGLEFCYGIPGTVGGGVFMNAGAYGGALSDVMLSATVLFPDGSVEEIPVEKAEMEYRFTRFMREHLTVLGAKFALSCGNKAEIEEKMKQLILQRKSKQPLEYPSAGSYFKRPAGNFAGKLIEDSGLKGFSLGGAAVSSKHAGFLINIRDATSADVLALEQKVRETVMEKFGVSLECEVQKLPEFPQKKAFGEIK